MEDIVLSSLTWYFSIFNVLGTILNIKNSPLSFLIWTICNVFWVYYDSCMLFHARLLIDLVNLLMSFYGFLVWSKFTKSYKYLKHDRWNKNSNK